jgi:hypothetical protein
MSVPNQLRPVLGPRLLAAAGIGGFFLLVAHPGAAVPAFARKYHTSCATCHTVFPKLNPYGEAFRFNGYHLPGEAQSEDVVKDKPISLGAEAYKRIWPEALWPSDLPAHVPLAINTKFANVYSSSHTDTGTEITHNDFQFPQEVNLFGAGTLGENFAFFSELTYSQRPDGGSDVEIEHAQIQVVSPFGADHTVNFKIGRFAPNFAEGFQEMWIMTDNGIDTLFSYDPIGLRGGTGLSDSPQGVSLPARIQGLEMWGVAAHRLFYTVGVANGIGPGATGNFDANAGKDFYARVDYKIGGMGLDGDTTGVTLPAENWRERSLRVGLFDYLGDGSHILFPVTAEDGTALQVEDPRFNRVGLFASLYFQDLNLFGAAVRGTDRLRLFDSGGAFVSQRTRDYNAWFLQADYVVLPPFQVSLRYEDLRPADPTAPRTEALNANLSFLVRANIKVMLEYHRDLKDSKNYQLNTLLRFAY